MLQAAGRNDEAAVTLERAVERYERKKNLAMAGQVRERLEQFKSTDVNVNLPSGRAR